VVSRLIRNFSDDHLVRLNAHLQKEIDAETGPEPVSIRLATEFHILLAQLTESPVLIRYVEEIGYRCGLTLAPYSRPHSTDCGIQEHREIIDALSKGDEARARERMGHHLGAVADRALIKPETEGPLLNLDAVEPYVRSVREDG
jgi:DNA-binding GntR family transcriptional regulator